MSKHVLEVAKFAVAPSVDEAEFLTAAAQSSEALKALPGFVARRLARSDDGWLDIVEWTDAASAQKAAGVFHTLPDAQPFCAMIDMGSATMSHCAVVASA
jgi:proteasome lid subunit RPN8/RPN11